MTFFQTPNYVVDLLVPFIPKDVEFIWECAAGDGKIVYQLRKYGYDIIGTDLKSDLHTNFLDYFPNFNFDCIITNPPFSLKYKFIYKALEYDVPFAFLIPFDMCQKMARLFMDYGVQGLVPTARIDYLTPNGKQGKESSSQFHSFWLCYKFDLPNQLTFVELTKKEKENI